MFCVYQVSIVMVNNFLWQPSVAAAQKETKLVACLFGLLRVQAIVSQNAI